MQQLLPFYVRFASTLNQYYPEVGNELKHLITTDFTNIQKQIEAIPPQAKTKNIRFIGELVKFGILGEQYALDCLKVCLDDFNVINIDLVINLLESCGPFLVNSLDTGISQGMSNLLDYLWRIRQKETISSMQANNLDSAYYLCRPSQNP